jgi:enoyl-CoA hydratase/carnithine racemase
MTAEYSTILYDPSRAPVAWLTLNRPDKRNPVSPLTIGELLDALKVAEADSNVHVIVLTGAGKVFSAGGDLSMMAGQGASGGGSIEPSTFVRLFSTMHQLGKPIIAMVNGHALAGGLGLMVACDLVVASDDATFGTTEIKVGLWPMMITAELVRNIGRKRALELMLTGKRISAERAAQLGLVNEVVPKDDLLARTTELAESIAELSPATIALGLRAFYGTQDMDHGSALSHLQGKLGEVLALDDAKEGVMAFLHKRKPVWKGR